MRIALCVITLDRPKALARCLDGIAALEVPDGSVEVSVVVVDNDAAGSAREVVGLARVKLPWPVTYLVEPVRGIPQARNCALAAAGAVDAVAFIDDDESPRPEWLRAMVREWRATDADILMGASVPAFEGRPPAWIVDGGYFQRPRFATGEAIVYNFVRTSGVVIDRTALPAGPEVFAPSFRLSGGSDTQLFERMERAGCSFVWVDDAIVDDFVPPSRASARWLLRRGFRYGNTRSLILVAKGASPRRRAKRVAAALCYGAVSTGRALPSLRQGRPGLMRLAQVFADTTGQISAVVGFTYEEYKRVHGS